MNMVKNHFLVSFGFCVLVCAFSRELHHIEPLPGKCFDSYVDEQPIDLSNLAKACVERLPTENLCYGLQLTTNEILIVHCENDSQQLEKGCYRFFDKDLNQSVVCQKYVQRNMCEILKTPENLAIEIYCHRSQPGIVMVKKLKIHD